ncbi:hypothetical protein ACH4JS_03550 [Streptomyces sp. NPDC017638]|uniref:hypothetical protein n=1 Tax=Streptomyces sp. NPDC017638 TaxID=3365004 RepID=UPI003799A9F4
MQGHGYGQPAKQPPHTAWLVFLRVLFVALGILTLGFLSWVMLLRLAAVTRRSLDWGLFVAVLTADVLAVVLLAVEPGDEIHTTGGYVGLFLVLGTLVGTIGYYLAADIRHFLRPQEAYAVPGARAYGYPGPATPYGATTVPTAPAAAGVPSAPAMPAGPAAHRAPVAPHTPPPVPLPPVPGPPPAAPVPRRPAPARIDQVRAELDELSDYLRRRDGHEGGR